MKAPLFGDPYLQKLAEACLGDGELPPFMRGRSEPEPPPPPPPPEPPPPPPEPDPEPPLAAAQAEPNKWERWEARDRELGAKIKQTQRQLDAFTEGFRLGAQSRR